MRQEIDLAVAGGVSERGRVHSRNEDAMYVRAVDDRQVVAVVCDGISSSLSPHLAARRAADAAGGVLVAALQDGRVDLADAVTEAVMAAQQAVIEVRWTSRSELDAPSCTMVCACCRGNELAVGWVGDSRAYWIGRDGSRQLTVDHSWVQTQVAAGTLDARSAESDPRSHEVTRWLGRDAPTEAPPIVTMSPAQPGRLVLCSDGMWNYLPDAGRIAGLLDALPSGAAPIAAARGLADTALHAGGRDNITTAVVNVPPETDRA
jgi:serine/threonine protein phosphatase PrpC